MAEESQKNPMTELDFKVHLELSEPLRDPEKSYPIIVKKLEDALERELNEVGITPDSEPAYIQVFSVGMSICGSDITRASVHLPDKLRRSPEDDDIWGCSIPQGSFCDGDVVEVVAEDGANYKAQVVDVMVSTIEQVSGSQRQRQHNYLYLEALERLETTKEGDNSGSDRRTDS